MNNVLDKEILPPLCDCMQLLFNVISLKHTREEKNDYVECFRICFFKVDRCENADLHISQENGFSPVCIRM